MESEDNNNEPIEVVDEQVNDKLKVTYSCIIRWSQAMETLWECQVR